MLPLQKRAGGLALALILGIVVFGFAAPSVLGMASARRLEESTQPDRPLDVHHMVPGDTYQRTIEFHNSGAEPVRYRLVLVRRGRLWTCDNQQNSLQVGVLWTSTDADQVLDPGETETATVVVRFPLGAGNACQGELGRLVIRKGYTDASEPGGIYECSGEPLFSGGSGIPNSYDGLAGHVCWEVGKTLDTLIRR
jgi:hypothetical protein